MMVTVMAVNVVEGIDNQLLAVTLPSIAEAWGTTPAAFAPAMTAGFVGAAVATPIGGWLGDRIGRKRTVLAGMLLFATAILVTGLCTSLGMLTAVRLFTGLGLGTCLPPMLALVIESVRRDQQGTAVALTMFSLPLGLTLSGVAGPLLVGGLGWRGMFLLSGAVSLALGAIAACVLKEPPRPAPATIAGPASKKGAWRTLCADRAVITALPTLIFLVYVIMSAALNWLPALLSQSGHSLALSSGAISAWSFAGMGGTLAAGWTASRLGPSRAVRSILCLLIASLAVDFAVSKTAALATDPGMALFLVLIGVTGFLVNAAITAIYALTAERFAPQVRSSGIGLISFSGKIGGISGAAAGPLLLATGTIGGMFGILLPVACAAFAIAALLGRISSTFSAHGTDLTL